MSYGGHDFLALLKHLWNYYAAYFRLALADYFVRRDSTFLHQARLACLVP